HHPCSYGAGSACRRDRDRAVGWSRHGQRERRGPAQAACCTAEEIQPAAAHLHWDFSQEPPNVWITVSVTEHNVGRSGFTPSFFGRRAIAPSRRPPTTAMSKRLHSLPLSIRRIIQPRAPPAWSQGQVVVQPNQSCEEIDGHSLPVSALIYGCMLELIASRMQSVISTMS